MSSPTAPTCGGLPVYLWRLAFDLGQALAEIAMRHIPEMHAEVERLAAEEARDEAEVQMAVWAVTWTGNLVEAMAERARMRGVAPWCQRAHGRGNGG